MCVASAECPVCAPPPRHPSSLVEPLAPVCDAYVRRATICLQPYAYLALHTAMGMGAWFQQCGPVPCVCPVCALCALCLMLCALCLMLCVRMPVCFSLSLCMTLCVWLCVL